MTSMESILRVKYDSCKSFRQALMNSGNKHLIETTSQPYWGCGLRKSVASHIYTNYLPGKNMLGGELLMMLRKTKKRQLRNNYSVPN